MHSRNVLLLGLNGSVDIFHGIVGCAKERGWNLMIEDPATLASIPRCDGIIVTLLNLPDKLRLVRQAIRARIPVIDLNDEILMRNLSRVTVDFAAAGTLAARHFAERGFKRTAWFSIDDYRMHALVKNGFGRIWSGEPLQNWSRDVRNDLRGFDGWLKTTLQTAQKPIAVLTFNTYNAFRLLTACQAVKISVPDDIAILSATNETPFLDSGKKTTISYVAFDYEALGREAAQSLERIMSGAIPSQVVRLAPRRICLGSTTDAFTTDDPLVRAALHYIHDHLAHPFNAVDVAAHLGVSRVTLDRQVLAKTGRTIGKEILRQRMSMIQDLLVSTDMKLEAIAASTGMCHASYLIKTFTREHRISPTAYRKTMRS